MFRKLIALFTGVLSCAVLAVTQSHAQVITGPRPVVPGGITDKPFLKNFDGGIAIGGYLDHEFSMTGNSSSFNQHRFIPFIFAQPVEYIHVAAAIEFEYGGFVRSTPATDGEIKLEYAFMDWLVTDAQNFRGGVIWVFGYELYFVNGFNDKVIDGNDRLSSMGVWNCLTPERQSLRQEIG